MVPLLRLIYGFVVGVSAKIAEQSETVVQRRSQKKFMQQFGSLHQTDIVQLILQMLRIILCIII